VTRLRALGDARLRERADDLIDIERQVLRALSGEAGPPCVDLPEEAILLAEDLLPSDFAALDTAKLAGLCTARGGPTSHLAILAASRGVPALVAAGRRVLDVADGAPVVLDADAGVLHLDPLPERIEAARRRLEAHHTAAEQARKLAAEPCRMADGLRIEVFANVGSETDARAASAQGAEGCGLLRTEFLFLDRQAAPDEDEQLQAYQAVADALAGRPVIVRTLDVGADKPAPYLNLPHEENPALGLRGVRVSLAHPELLRTQLRAVLRVQPAGQCRIMLPMVSSVEEVRAVRAVLDPLARELGAGEVQLGIMVETPAAALLAERLAAEADFFSIGSNDLSQYTLAIDRGDPRLAGQADAMHPAVLRLIGLAAEGAASCGRPVGVCGGLASDPLTAPVLIGLGVTELSATPRLVPQIKARVRGLTLDVCRELAQAALGQETAAAVRRLVRERLPDDR
jgi:phosphocarrier protein FPr/phosphocarrier protein